jgi:mono/diheme cytochrome c family protein
VRRTAALLACLAFALGGLAACGGDDDGDNGGAATTAETPTETGGGGADGAAVFASAGCGSCHAFEAAGSSGGVGPSLDDSSVTVEAAAEQVRSGGGGMPPFEGQLSDDEIQAVAEYVVENRSG